MIDPGGNWLRVFKLGDSEEEASAEKAEGLAQIILVAARLGDAHGDEALALKTLETGLARFPEATTGERVRAYLYRAELAVRLHDSELAHSSLMAAKALQLTNDEQVMVADEMAHVTELVQTL